MPDQSTFAARHIGPDSQAVAAMLAVIGVDSLDELASKAVPAGILDRLADNGAAPGLDRLPAPASETEALAELRALADANTVAVSMIGQGYYDTLTPPVLLRNILENPAWYTAYTPYQPEISQGRLEALLNFQTMVADLTGLEVANASMLDEGTAAAEAMTLMHRAARGKTNRLAVDADVFAQTAAILATRAKPLGIELVTADLRKGLPDGDFFGVVAQLPGAGGRVTDWTALVQQAHDRGALVAIGADLLACTLITPPGEIGADVAFGTTQRFGVPMGFGGPHAGYLAVHANHARQLPGRLVGVSLDADGNPAYRLALQTREQHIRRDKATSNICTAQVLLAVMAAMYASYHGAEGLTAIARRVHAHAEAIAAALGDALVHDKYFDTVLARVPGRAAEVIAAAKAKGINLWRVDDDHVSVACDEVTTDEHVAAVLEAFGVQPAEPVCAGITRTSEFLTHPAFTQYRTETAMMRYLRTLADKDIALDRSMIPLGSCTMKLNAAAEMEPITWPEFARQHPFAPASDTPGLRRLIADLETWLVHITGYDAVSLQPNAGSQGEYAGLLAIHDYHASRGEPHRDICLIPSSAHGTNAASAALAGMRVVVVACHSNGDVDLDDLRAKVAEHGERLSTLMITYPSTHGVYEHDIADICAAVHDAGGQVYVDGANLNALVGLARPGKFGGDVSHLNLHKTFCIPHGGGGPGVGPVAVRSHLAAFLPGHPHAPELPHGHPVSSAPYGSASILPISWAYIRMMGAEGLRAASLTAITSANYIARRLDEYFPVLYTGENGMVAHECILDLRGITKDTGVTVDDVAKRLADYGFHAPTMSFPVAGTLMVEPTESETLTEVDAFCEAMIAIRREIDRVGAGEWSVDDNPLRGAPHTAECLVIGEWDHPYTREEAAYPLGKDFRPKVWPPVRRIDGAYGDRNLVCSCPPVEAFA
ncbi:aminomethyl-transferring glycine dehydrogenase [Mycobacterium intracellulare subsp. intracellulare]|uniref:Glycine dehydrogenase (decarboxylating) n=1 Tax=Mycobacterium intracellulare (strain ATCC 13950 / DSM 43223 / JCM 6384 / NCTC 13025 / 3600) TaxID=487521 RepID=H8IMU4_MYCIA|nr:aminomethyl-transferring glycine dehydrogenase [Mycobacterium intracellulare]AFC43922.1 glycine dehydrogenase [Mycobacterium intracellulare ATCC 13950]EUA27571.1 glycine dehydrogenase [Mycobacterium intracellulare]UGU08533.1 aminomethyl-transferring glycine dehydrogenase [Mycobacterium intracellulare subsp. intracellulare]UQC05228.1 aminomethyl-transferring glycine dehydrogenase [Mycobacterium intracellulare ATCC 13950]BCO47057.1 putative glycine dehydrogenase (decarboxylating) [Mycobacteri